MAIAAIPPVTGPASAHRARPSEREAVAFVAAPRARRAGSARSAADPIDVDVLWEELETAPTPARPRWRPYVFGGVAPLAPPAGAVSDAYASAMRRPPRPARVDLLAV